MPRPATGSVVEPTGSRKSWAIRFRVEGRRINESLGTGPEWNRTRAEEVLRDRLDEVRLGIWKPKEPKPVVPPAAQSPDPLFREFAERWFEQNQPNWKPRTVNDYKLTLEVHLLPFFAEHRLSEITAEEIDRYTTWKRQEGRLSANTINKTLAKLSQVLSLAEDYELIARNPVGKKRRLKPEPRSRTWVQPEQLMTLLDSCGDKGYRPLVAVMAGAGLRVGEALAVRWGDVSLLSSSVRIRDAKTAAGVRTVELPLGLARELGELYARSHYTDDEDPVFRGRGGAAQSARATQARLKRAIPKANERLAALGIEPLEDVTPHSLRRCYASMRFAMGDDPVWVAAQLGHTTPSFSMSVYAAAVKRRQRLSGAHLEEFDRALEWASMGAESPSEDSLNLSNSDTEPIEDS